MPKISTRHRIKLKIRWSSTRETHCLYEITLKVTGQATAAKENSSCLRSTNIAQGAAGGGPGSLC